MAEENTIRAAYAVVTASGPDRPGLVDDVSKLILNYGCSIADTRMAELGGEFVMLLLVAAAPASLDALIAELPRARERLSLTFDVRPTKPPAPREGPLFALRVRARDRRGIVQRLSHFLAQRGVNIRAIDGRREPIEGGEAASFSMHATVELPADIDVGDVRSELDALGIHEGIEVELAPLPE